MICINAGMQYCTLVTAKLEAYESTLPRHVPRPNTASVILALGTRLRKPRLCGFDSLELCVGLCYCMEETGDKETHTRTVKTIYPTSCHGEIALCVVCLTIDQ